MPYRFQFMLFLLIVGVIAALDGVLMAKLEIHWAVMLMFAIVSAYLLILVGRKILKRARL